MSSIPSFSAGTLAFQRFDGVETRIWLGPATAAHCHRAERTWKPTLRTLKTLDAEWDWTAEVRAAAGDKNRLVLAACERNTSGRLHALMNLILLPRGSRLTPGRDVLYVDMLAVAPWNRPTAPVREIKGLGPMMIHAAVLVSRECGLRGAFGLHSLPDPNTLRFYRDTIGMTPVGLETLPEGKLLYFESSVREAEAFMAREAEMT